MKTLITKSTKKAASFIKRSEIVAFPTETVYGLGANSFDEKALRKIFVVKRRPLNNPLIVHILRKDQIELLTKETTPIAKKLITRFFPGPLTIILNKNEIIPEIATAGLSTIAIRMPSSLIARKFIRESGVPIAAPSANLSGSPSPTTYQHVLEDFKGKIPCILIGPDSKFGLESTVVDCTSKIPAVLRPGVVTLEQLKKVDSRIKLRSGGKSKSPGQKFRHYAPKARVILVSTPDVSRTQTLLKQPKSGPVIPVLPFPLFPFSTEFALSPMPSPLTVPLIASRKTEKRIKPIAFIGLQKLKGNVRKHFKICLKCRSVEDYARNLFSFFRDCDRNSIKIIYAQKVPEKGVGLALMNRLEKASK